MKNTSPKVIALLVTTLLMLNMFAILAIRPATAVEELPDYEPMDWQTSQAGSPVMPTIEETPAEGIAASVATVESFATTPPVGTKAYDWYLEAISIGTVTGTQPWMTLKAVSGNVEVWLQDYLWYPPGDPRNNYDVVGGIQHGLLVTDEMCQYVADEFNNVIYPTDTSYFGAPADRDGTNTIFQQLGYPSYYWDWIATDNPQRVILKVLNIRDTGYYNPAYPYYTVGFYSSTYTRTYYKRNMIHIDCWRWWQRLGPTGKKWFPVEAPNLIVPPARAFLMESVVAHEFQHNIHRDWNPNDPSFMNEGCSDYAQMLCGYPDTVWGHVNYYLYTPDNSLTEWGDQGDINILADYGAGLLWAVYLVDHYGGPAFLSHFVKAGIPGIAGVDAALAYYGYTQKFDDVYHDWRIANLIHSDKPGDGRYDYQSIDLGGPKAIPAFRHTISGTPVPPTKGTDFGTTWTWNGNLGNPGPAYDTGIATIGPYGSDYIVMNNWNQKSIVYFDGDDTAVYGWAMTADGWYSGGPGRTVNLINDLLYGAAYVDPLNPILTIVTKYDIEYLWDFGFIQVSTDGGAHWTSQSNIYTTMNHDPSALPAIIANLPGLTGNNPGYPAWTTMTFDLTAYAGQTVRIGFRYMTDSATLGLGWWLQSAKVGGIDLTLSTGRTPLDANFQVSEVRVYVQDGTIVKYIVNDMELDSTSETGTKGTNVVAPNYVILVVSSVGRTGVVDYEFQAKNVPIKGDVNYDGKANSLDIGLLNAHWSPAAGTPSWSQGYDPDIDTNGDDYINSLDIGVVNTDWGKSWNP